MKQLQSKHYNHSTAHLGFLCLLLRFFGVGQHDVIGWLRLLFILPSWRRVIGCFGSGGGLVDLRQLGCDFLKEFLDIGSCFGTNLLEQNLISMGKLFSLFVRDIPFFKVDLVGQEGDDYPISTLVFHIINPLLHACEGVSVRDIVYDNCHRCIADVVWDECFESLLACCVPELESDGLILQEDILRDEIDADGRTLYRRVGTCSLPSKISQMKRLMMEDLPTAWSPRKTILYLRSGGMVPFERFKLLMFVILSKFITLFQNTRNPSATLQMHYRMGKGQFWV